MSLFTRNMKPSISCNGDENILNNVLSQDVIHSPPSAQRMNYFKLSQIEGVLVN
jgi:hypothetical protein